MIVLPHLVGYSSAQCYCKASKDSSDAGKRNDGARKCAATLTKRNAQESLWLWKASYV